MQNSFFTANPNKVYKVPSCFKKMKTVKTNSTDQPLITSSPPKLDVSHHDISSEPNTIKSIDTSIKSPSNKSSNFSNFLSEAIVNATTKIGTVN